MIAVILKKPYMGMWFQKELQLRNDEIPAIARKYNRLLRQRLRLEFPGQEILVRYVRDERLINLGIFISADRDVKRLYQVIDDFREYFIHEEKGS